MPPDIARTNLLPTKKQHVDVEQAALTGKTGRATKCPCYNNNRSCTTSCQCTTCLNGNNETRKETNVANVTNSKRAKRMAKTHIKERTTTFLKEKKDNLTNSTWTNQETTALICCELMLEYFHIRNNIVNLHTFHYTRSTFYSMLSNNAVCKGKPLYLRDKTLKSVEFKMLHLETVQNMYK